MKNRLFAGAAVGALLGTVAAVTPALAEDASTGKLVPGSQLAQVPPPPLLMPTWTGAYAGLNFGFTWSNDQSVRTTSTNVSSIAGLNGDIGGQVAANGTGRVPVSNNGFIGGGQIGYNQQYNNIVFGLETDIQGAWNDHRTSSITKAGVPGALIPVPSTGMITSSKSLDYLGTLRGRIGFLPTPSLLAFATGGLAYGGVNTSTRITETLGFVDTPTPFGVSRGLSSTQVGWTAGAGLEWMLASNVSAKVEYLYYDLGSVTNKLPSIQQFGGLGTVLETVANSRSVTSFTGSYVRAGINYHFGAPPPPPPAPMAMPAPPPAAPKVFIVFFDWDKDTITREGMGIIQQAADAYKSGAPVQIQVTGYTDRSGSPGYNQRLSERRANNVAKALAARGVPPAQMVVSGHGENDNRVPTADGVREPQNRRVEIIAP